MAMLLGKFFLTRVAVIPGHVVKKSAVIVVVHDDTTGLKAALWRYFVMYALVDRVWTLLEHVEFCGRCVFVAGLRCWSSM